MKEWEEHLALIYQAGAARKAATMAEEPRYCPKCRAPWVWGNDFCVQCGFRLPSPSVSHSDGAR